MGKLVVNSQSSGSLGIKYFLQDINVNKILMFYFL